MFKLDSSGRPGHLIHKHPSLPTGGLDHMFFQGDLANWLFFDIDIFLLFFFRLAIYIILTDYEVVTIFDCLVKFCSLFLTESPGVDGVLYGYILLLLPGFSN